MSRDLTDLVRYLAEQLVDRPEAIRVQGRDGVYWVRCDPEDQGRLIGRDGRTIHALRTLVAAAGKKAGVRATVELEE